MPRFLIVLLFTEMWERFSYYGMRALLVLFLTSQLGFSDPRAYGIYSLMSALCYAGPLIGGYLADRFLGFRNMVLIGGMVLVLGHAIMSLIGYSDNLLYVGLALIAVGTGLFKGNISNLLGTCYKESDPGRDKAFTLFYVSVNVGSTLATFACGYAAHSLGWDYGFGLAGIGMTFGLIFFFMNKDLFNNDIKARTSNIKVANISLSPMRFVTTLIAFISVITTLMLVYQHAFSQSIYVIGLITVVALFFLLRKLPKKEQSNVAFLFTLAFFQMLFATEIQLGTLYNLFTARNVDFSLFGYQLPTAISQSINPISIMVLGPIMAIVFSKYFKGLVLSRMNLGLLAQVISFAVIYIGCKNAANTGLVNIYYLIGSISLIGFGELCIAPLLLNQCTILAPQRLKGLLMGVNMLSLAFASMAGNIIASFMSIDTNDQAMQNPLASLEIYTSGFFNITVWFDNTWGVSTNKFIFKL